MKRTILIVIAFLVVLYPSFLFAETAGGEARQETKTEPQNAAETSPLAEAAPPVRREVTVVPASEIIRQKKPEIEGLLSAAQETSSIKERVKFNKLSRGSLHIYKATMRSNVVYRLQTALGFVSTIDLPEPALKVFAGDQELFKVGVYEREVLIKPITDYPDARTNLTIIMATGRLTFDVTVGPPDTADFVIDFRLPEEDILVENAFKKAVDERREAIKKEYEEKEKNLNQKAENLANTKLKEEVAKSVETIEIGSHQKIGDLSLNLISGSKIGGKVYLRFGVRNHSRAPYKVSKVVIGLESYGRKTLGLRKEPEGLIELSSEIQFPSEVPVDHHVYGVIVFDVRVLAAKERPVFLLFEDGGNRNFKIRSFRWIN